MKDNFWFSDFLIILVKWMPHVLEASFYEMILIDSHEVTISINSVLENGVMRIMLTQNY